MAAQKRSIELLPREEWEKPSFGQILKWALTVGRWIVIGTELVVILAFLSRFKLDRDLSNLYKDIKQKQIIIESNREFEDDFRFLQQRLATIKGLEQKELAAGKVLDEITLLTPVDVSFTEFIVAGQEINLVATALSEQGLSTFLNNLKQSPQFKNLVISSLSSGTEQGVGIQFELTSEYHGD